MNTLAEKKFKKAPLLRNGDSMTVVIEVGRGGLKIADVKFNKKKRGGSGES